ncbi:alkaline phosphatase family protein [Kribbella sp. NPDC026611]|uniref:alkaline phosphatase family protein n=1 Tax=Kribbella sp. NPDC026611 TaxID=3154911 RepID=UPI0033E85A7A
MKRKRIAAVLTAAAVVLASATAITGTTVDAQAAPTSQAAAVPVFDHIVLVMFENHAYSQISGSSSAPTFNSLAGQGAKFSQAYGVTHPSEPNYLAIFSGKTQGVTDDSCPHTYSGSNLGSQLIAAGKTFKGYSESMPSDGYTGCSSGEYRRKHNGWVNFTNVPATSNLRYSVFPSSANYASLPTVSFVTPNMCNDMHDCSVGTGDTWLKNNLTAYATWAKTHNSLLIITFDEDNGGSSNHIFTAFVGAHTQVGTFSNQINHYNVLSTVESSYGLTHLNSAAEITNVWN